VLGSRRGSVLPRPVNWESRSCRTAPTPATPWRSSRPSSPVTYSEPSSPGCPALVFALGALLILLEIFTAQALLSQIGNIMSLGAGVRFAWLLSHGNQAGALSQSGRVGAGAVH